MKIAQIFDQIFIQCYFIFNSIQFNIKIKYQIKIK